MIVDTSVANQVIQVLEYIGNKLGIAIDWSSENVLPYLEELLTKLVNWKIHTSWMWLIIAISLVVIGVVLIVLDIVNFQEGFAGFIGGILFIVGAILAVFMIHNIITCKYLPEKFIVEYISHLMQA